MKAKKVEDVTKTAEKMKKFILDGMRGDKLTDALYRDFMYMWGHIAHYDRGGFASVWFDDDETRLRFLEQALSHVTYPGHEHRGAQLERLLVVFIQEQGLVEVYRRKVADAVEAQERAELVRLQAKYGVAQ